MKLAYRKYGEGPALVVLHGLYGSSDNWAGIARELASDFEVFVPDQRNHGASPHTSEHNYLALRSDLLAFLDEHRIKKAILLGHSMGGKTAMFFAAAYPGRVQALIAVDISPRSYLSTDEPVPHTLDHLNVMAGMLDIDFSKANSRMDLDMMLASTVKSSRVRQFLLKNVTRDKYGVFHWKINLETLHKELPRIIDGLNPNDFQGGNAITGFPVLFIKGADSDYIVHADTLAIRTIFPAADIVTIPNSGHWVHAEQPELFIKTVRYFLGATRS